MGDLVRVFQTNKIKWKKKLWMIVGCNQIITKVQIIITTTRTRTTRNKPLFDTCWLVEWNAGSC
jgi:hypothetical protein